jgi:undecaprenyl pyrophosphate phosphatase UppP
MDWMGMKELAADLYIAKDALHIYLAFIIQICAAVLFRKSLSNALPWLTVLLFELVNEGLDMWLGEDLHIKQWQLVGAAHDLVNTMILPTALLLLCRHAPAIFRRGRT